MAFDSSSGFDSLPKVVRETICLINGGLLGRRKGDFPRLVSATASTLGERIEDADFVFEIGPDATMLANFHRPIAGCDLAGNVTWVAGIICDHAVKATAVTDDLMGMLIKIRDCASSLVANARLRDLPVSLISIHVAEFGLWVEPHDAQFLVTIESLGNHLRPRPLPLLVGSVQQLERMFATNMRELERRAVARARFTATEASGKIDLLAMNAISHSGAIMPTLRSMIDGDRITITGVEIVWRDGEIHSATGPWHSLNWCEETLTLDGFLLPESACIEAIGRPVTDMISHLALTSNMMIRCVDTNEAQNLTEVVLDVPKFFFNLDTGRIWPC